MDIFFFISTFCDHGTERKNNDTQLKAAATKSSTVSWDRSRTIAENIVLDSSYSIFAESLKATDLYEMLSQPGPFTVFAPSNSAFRALPEGSLESLMSERRNDLVNILSHHIVAGKLETKDIETYPKMKTLAGDELIASKRNDEMIINGVRISARGTDVRNGIIYGADKLFFPKIQKPGAY